jgi:hypothetical protein
VSLWSINFCSPKKFFKNDIVIARHCQRNEAICFLNFSVDFIIKQIASASYASLAMTMLLVPNFLVIIIKLFLGLKKYNQQYIALLDALSIYVGIMLATHFF